jgi:hypothetical protein
MTDSEKLAALEAEVAALKKAVAPTSGYPTEREIAEWKDQMHQASERRMANAYSWSREELAAFDKAAGGTKAVQDIASHGTVQRPSAAGVSGTLTSTHSSPGLPGSTRGTGWVESKPLGPVPGLQHIDNIGEAFAARDRAEAIEQEAKRLRIAAALKAASE